MAHPSIGTVLPYAVNFTIFASLLFFFLRNPFKKFVFQRHERIKDLVGASARAREEAGARIAKASALIASLAQESKQMIADEIGAAKNDAAQIVERANQDSVRIKAEAKKIAENEAQEMSDSARAKFLSMAITEADASLRANLKKEQHNNIVSDARSRIEAGV